MGPFWHRKDFPQLPDEQKARAAIGSLGVPPGDYMLPRCKTMAEMRSPEFMQKMAEGPVWIITVRPNGVAGMGKPLVLWFVYIALVALFAGYIAAHSLARRCALPGRVPRRRHHRVHGLLARDCCTTQSGTRASGAPRSS